MNVYEVLKNNESIGHLAKSESSSYSDLFFDIEAFNVKKIVKESFKIIERDE